MLCPVCGIQARIDRSYTQVEGDQSPDTTTRVYTVQEIVCRNPQCPQYGEIIETAKNLDYEG